MALKGNLLFNGDFETGTTEGWINGAYGKAGQFELSVSADAKYLGNYGGRLYSTENFATSYIAYDKLVGFEENEAYLFVLHQKMISGNFCYGMLYGVDDKDNLIQTSSIGYINETGVWKKVIALLRQYNDYTHIKVGGCFVGEVGGGEFYFDEAKLVPLRSIKSVILRDYQFLDDLTANKTRYINLAIMGQAKVYSEVKVFNVGGTSPTLDIKLVFYHFDPAGNIVEKSHTQFTAEGSEVVTQEITDFQFIRVDYTVGGTDPTFDIYHLITVIPL